MGSEESAKSLRRGEIVEGIVMGVRPDGILVNIGLKSEGIVPVQEMRSLSPGSANEIKVGDSLLTQVLETETEETPVILSLDKARNEQGWRILERCLGSGELIEARLLGLNRGGAMVDVEGVQGFVPLSHLTSINKNSLDGEIDAGQTLKLKVLEADRRERRVILSERLALQEWKLQQKERLIKELKQGDVRRGRVTGLSSFGAFVDLGGADGLIHISEMSWELVNAPEDVLKIGDEIDVYVLKVDLETKKIALSLRRLHPEPWDSVTERYHVGQLITGTVTNLANFGAFARIEGSIEGLIHISELSDKRIQHPREVVKEGEVLTLKILTIEPDRRRLGLSLKQAAEEIEI